MVSPWKLGLLWWRRVRRVTGFVREKRGLLLPFYGEDDVSLRTGIGCWKSALSFIKIGASKWNSNFCMCVWPEARQVCFLCKVGFFTDKPLRRLWRLLFCNFLSGRGVFGEFMMTTSVLEHSHGSVVGSCFPSQVICRIFVSSSGREEEEEAGLQPLLPSTLLRLLFLIVVIVVSLIYANKLL